MTRETLWDRVLILEQRMDDMSKELIDLKAAYEGFKTEVTTGLATIGSDVSALVGKVETLQTQLAAPNTDAAEMASLAAEIQADTHKVQASVAALHQQATTIASGSLAAGTTGG